MNTHRGWCQCSAVLILGLRHFFCVILVAQGAPSRLLWDENREALSADFLGHYAHDSDLAYNLALRHIAHILALHSRTLEDEGKADACYY